MQDSGTTASDSLVFGAPQKIAPANSLGSKKGPAKRGRKKKLKKWQKPEGMPKRPLSAYNFFFAKQRQELLKRLQDSEDLNGGTTGTPKKTKGKIGFANLARTVAEKWKAISDAEKELYFDKATVEQTRYKKAVQEWQSLGLDPRVKKDEKKSMNELGYSNSAQCDHSPNASCVQTLPSQNLSIAHGRLLAASNSAASTAESLCIAAEVAKTTCWGDFYEVGCDPIEVDDSCIEPIAIDDLMGVRVLSCHKQDGTGKTDGDRIDYKLLSSTLFNQLSGNLDSDEVRYLKNAFARSA